MYTFFLTLYDFFCNYNFHWFLLFYMVIIIRWLVVSFFASKYKPYTCAGGNFFTSVIIPVVDEPVASFKIFLKKILSQHPDEIIVVINGPENPELRAATEEIGLEAKHSGAHTNLKVFYTPVPGKRNAIRIGVENSSSQSDITLLVDSDVLWTDDVLKNILMPFAEDELVGGVTTRQKILNPKRNLVTRIASILEDIRAEGSMKAMSSCGKVGCLPGRTIAFRTSILRESMDEFMTERFMGIHKEVSDDRSLTNITLKRGFKTVMQDTALVYTDCPTELKKYFRQQLRWAEGSQYNNLRMASWMLKYAKLMFYIFFTDMLMPFLLISTYSTWLFGFIARTLNYDIQSLPFSPHILWACVLIYIGSAISFTIRNIKILNSVESKYILFFPFLILFLSVFMVPIRMVGLARCADSLSWGTRQIVVSSAETVAGNSSTETNGYRILMRAVVLFVLLFFISFSFFMEVVF